MSPRRIERLLVACISLFSLVSFASSSARGQASVPIRKELVWFQPESEIDAPQFTADGKFIALVSRVHWPDGVEAEGLPDSFFKKLGERRRKDPRFADPVVRLIDLKGNQLCEIRYGSNPSVSPDGKKIAFSRQKKPISGLRRLAETLAGNDIQVFDFETKQTRTIAEPDSGYLDDPIFLPDGNSIVYTRNEAVNGAMGGSVGLERVDLADGHKEILVPKETTPAVPCPPAGSSMSAFQALMCSQPIKLSAAFPDLLLGFAMTDGHLLVLQGKPIPSAGDMYLATQYSISLKSVFPERNDILSLGQAQRGWGTSLQSGSDGRLMIFWQYWRPFSLGARKWLLPTGPRNANMRSIYSPDMKYYLAAEPAEPAGLPDHFTLYKAGDGKKLAVLPKMADVYGATWSRDSKRFAFVGVPRGAFGARYREDLTVYFIP
jgi:hypothetical protein